MKKILTNTQEKVLAMFRSYGSCPTMNELSKKVKLDKEYVRKTMWQLVEMKLVKVNNKLNMKKFYVGKK